MERGYELFGGENWLYNVWIDGGIVASSLFRVDVPSSCQHIRFGAESTRTETDYEVKLRKVFGASDLAAGEEFGCGKIFQVIVIHDEVDCFGRTFEVMVPGLESFENCEQFFVMDIIV